MSVKIIDHLPLLGLSEIPGSIGVRDPFSFGSPEMFSVGIRPKTAFRLFFNARLLHPEAAHVTQVMSVLLSTTDITALNQYHLEGEARCELRVGGYAAAGSNFTTPDGRCLFFFSPDTATGISAAYLPNYEPPFRTLQLLNVEVANCSRIGIPYVFPANGAYGMVFEGIASGSFGIYVAYSDNLKKWSQPQPLRIEADDGAWCGGGIANPSIWITPAETLLFFNGHRVGEPTGWTLGFARITHGTSPSPSRTYVGSPLDRELRKREAPEGRIEGLKILGWMRPTEVLAAFFVTPSSDSYAGSVIHLARLSVFPLQSKESDVMTSDNTMASGAGDL